MNRKELKRRSVELPLEYWEYLKFYGGTINNGITRLVFEKKKTFPMPEELYRVYATRETPNKEYEPPKHKTELSIPKRFDGHIHRCLHCDNAIPHWWTELTCYSCGTPIAAGHSPWPKNVYYCLKCYNCTDRVRSKVCSTCGNPDIKLPYPTPEEYQSRKAAAFYTQMTGIELPGGIVPPEGVIQPGGFQRLMPDGSFQDV